MRLSAPLIMIAVLLFSVGCTAKYQVTHLGGEASATIPAGSRIYVTLSRDGVYGATTYSGSGQIAAQSVAKAFARYAGTVDIAANWQERDEAIAYAKEQGFEYVAVPTITQWEQRATEWSGRPSRMGVRVAVYDVDGKLVDSTAIEGRSRIMSFTSTSPESLLRDPLNAYARQLFR